MDISEKFIKMCDKARLKHKPQEDDLYCVEKDIWIPTQDQLQEMVVETPSFISFIGVAHLMKENLNIFQFNTYEQLWLAFVMYEKYNKIWNNEKEEWNEQN